MKTAGIIPARFASTRLPGKPLAYLAGKTLIRRVYENALTFNLDHLWVATDSEDIAKEVESFGGQVIITPNHFESGTERVEWTLEQLKLSLDVVINIQGDEPFTPKSEIDLLLEAFQQPEVEIATLATPCSDFDELDRPSIIKVVLDAKQNALYFSRSLIPFQRENKNYPYLKHIGIYAFRPEILQEMVKVEATNLEQTEMLEQLRWLYYGKKIRVQIGEAVGISIDTPEDLEKAIKIITQTIK